MCRLPTQNIALNVVVAFILETFLSRMSFERAYDKELADDTTSTTVYLAHAEVQKYFRRQSRAELMALVDDWVKVCLVWDCGVNVGRELFPGPGIW